MKILIINGNTRSNSLCNSLCDAYESGAKENHEVRRIDIAKLTFDCVLWEGYGQVHQKLEPDLKKARQDILWAEHIVLAYPTWWGYLPSRIKGFFDRIFLPGFAFKYTSKYAWDKLLKGRTGRIITTAGGPKWYYTLFLQGGGHRLAKNIIFEFCGIKTKVSFFGMVDKVADAKRKQWVKQVKRLGEAAR